ncbi:MAG: helix-turn-helix domain-containing protein [Candidatus Nitrosocaldus sp.]|nr:helix-turn-helix domain-containing protein [Candidatus Nitrosocaldus sp.]MDW8275363.1 helix-turn-helix domain-containing protein [Candidatus Nitrosocaldus sp.]
MVSMEEVEDAMARELMVSMDLIKVYMLLLRKGMLNTREIADGLGMDVERVKDALSRLVDDGACIEINGRYEALNPRFAVTNMYRMLCLRMNREVKRNERIDGIASILAKVYDDARR